MILRQKSTENTGFTFIYTSSHKFYIRAVANSFIYVWIGREAGHMIRNN